MLVSAPGLDMIDILGWASLLVLGINATAAVLASVLRLRTATIPDGAAECKPAAAKASCARPFFSIHVPTHDEPPEMLMATLDALARVEWADWEVIIIDNNTPDPQNWQPVAAHCQALGPRFRFHHRDAVVGAKAGALNIALALTDRRATHVAIVDADYRVLPDFLARAADALAAHGADYVQFPQAYRHGANARPVADELGDYFRAHAPSANRSQSMLLTGTLCAIDRHWLERVGGWPTGTITEDAELGMAMFRAGARGVFVNRVVGMGMLPLDFSGLALQRERWVAGNIQTLAGGLRLGWSAEPRGQLSVLTQLLAWPGFLALPVAALLLSALLRLWIIPAGVWAAAEALASGTIAVALAAMALECAILKRQPEALTVKLSLVWTASLAWLPLLWRSRPQFRRTPKAGSPILPLPRSMRWGGAVLAAAAALLAGTGAPYAAVALLLPLLSLPAAVLVDAGLRAAAVDLLPHNNSGCSHALPHRHSDLQPR